MGQTISYQPNYNQEVRASGFVAQDFNTQNPIGTVYRHPINPEMF